MAAPCLEGARADRRSGRCGAAGRRAACSALPDGAGGTRGRPLERRRDIAVAVIPPWHRASHFL